MAKKTYTVKTKAPTGLTVTRNKNAFTLTWKKGDVNYDAGQTCRRRFNNGSFADLTVSKTATSRVHAVNMADFWPNANKPILSRVQYAVRGTRSRYTKKRKVYKPTVSDWAYVEFKFQAPAAPTLSMTKSDSYANVATFNWTATSSDTDHAPFHSCEYQSILVKNCTETDGSKLSWKSGATGWLTGTSGLTGSREVSENTSLLASASYTRWFRVRSRGAGGGSAWRYYKRVYARPNQVTNKSVSATPNNAGGYLCQFTWTVGAPASNPIEKVKVQYTIATPDTGLACPSGASWTDVTEIKDTSATDGAAFTVDSVAGADECLYVRANTTYDNATTEGVPMLAAVGDLADPTGLSVSTNASTYRATITATNNSTVTDSFLEVLYRTTGNPGGFCIGVIPHGSSSVTVQCPEWSGSPTFAVRAVVGAYKATTRADGVTSYAVTERMTSKATLTHGGAVPVAPENVTLAMTETSGTIQVTFDWSWTEADAAEISWADHADAWESTDEPETYTISNTHSSRWNISGLETGVTWYVRVRLISGGSDAATYGAYSDIQSIDLSSAPITPVLSLSSGVITEGDSVTASWVYVSTDTTYQAYAEVAEYVGGEYTVIAAVETAQYVTIKADEAGWNVGEEHLLAVRVTSASGRQTGWSDPVAVIVAVPLTCEISDTSLEETTDIVNPREYNGDMVTYDSDVDGPITSLIVEMEPQQDLNGYDHPWPGGGGKNLIMYPYQSGNTLVSNGITWTANADGSVTANGTSTGTSLFWLYGTTTSPLMPTLEEGMSIIYTINGKASEGGINGQMVFYGGEAITLSSSTNAQTVPSMETHTGMVVVLRIGNGTTVNNVTVYPMIRLSSIADSTWEPYANICPITGYDSVTVTMAGKNLLPDTHTSRTINGVTFTKNADGSVTANGTATANINYALSPAVASATWRTYGKTYIVSTGVENGSADTWFINGYASTPDKSGGAYFHSLIGNVNVYKASYEVDLSDYTGYFGQVYLRIVSGCTLNNKTFYPMVRLADIEDSTYEAPQATNINAGLTSVGTVYGGTLDVVSGVLTVTHAYVDMGTLSWIKNSATSFEGYSIFQVNNQPRKPGMQATSAVYATCYARDFGTGGVATTLPSYHIRGHATLSNVYVVDPRYNTAADLKAGLSGQYMCYELESPIEYSLTPHQITSLIGANTVYSDVDSVTIDVADSVLTVTALTEMPLTVTATGAGDGGMTTVSIERAEAYHVSRPDETEFDGYQGETVSVVSQMGEGQIIINRDDLIGYLDDGAAYRLVANVQDGLGQTATSSMEFVVDWEHQAVVPGGTVEIDNENIAAKITPVAPDGALSTDTCDIYRLSVDRPMLIYAGAEFGGTYVDPYPTIGEYGGYRIVTKTADGDYITESNELAWLDVEAEVENDYNIIDFGTGRVMLMYNPDVSGQWSKDFKETKYLGGAVQGDWNPAVSRSGSVASVAVTYQDQETIEAMRRLAVYPGICHVRTKDGSSYAANVEVSESYTVQNGHKLASFSLSITRVDPSGYEAVTLSEWESTHQEVEDGLE